MGQKLREDKLNAMTESGGTITLPASTINPIYLTLGGQQYKYTTNTTLAIGSPSANSLYFVYAFLSGGNLALDLNTSIPSVYLAANAGRKLVGAFYTNAAGAFNGFVASSGITTPTFTIITATGTGTYTTPPRATYLRVRMVGGGAGGSGSGTGSIGNGGAGGDTIFGTLTAAGAPQNNGATPGGGDGGVGGTGTIGSGWTGEVRQGGAGQSYNLSGTNAIFPRGGNGGNSGLGNGAQGRGYNGGGINALANSGGGGAGAGANEISNTYGGIGGGGGGFIDATTVGAPLATYSYDIKQTGPGFFSNGGSAGAGGLAGGIGGSGKIIVEEGKPSLQDLADL